MMSPADFVQKNSFTRRLVLTLAIAVLFLCLKFFGTALLNYRFMQGFSRIFELQQASRYLANAQDEVELAAITLQKAAANPVSVPEEEQNFQEYLSHIGESLQEFRRLIEVHEELLGFIDTIEPAWKSLQSFQKESASAFAELQRERSDPAEGHLMIAAQFKLELQETLTKVRLIIRNNLDTEFPALYRERHYPIVMGATLTLLLAVTMSFLGIRLTRSFKGSVQNLLETTKRVARGDLSAQASILENDEFGLLTDAFNRMVRELSGITVSRDRWEKQNLELKTSNQELEQFAFFASHDLQEPLRKIQSFTELLGEYLSDSLDPEARKYMAYVTEGTNRMRQLIQDLLIYSRAGSRELQKSLTDLNGLVARVLETLDDSIRASEAEITVGKLPVLPVTASLIEQVFQNLIGNAVKFRAQDHPMRISFTAESSGSEWTFTVHDNGIGIDPVYHGKIFEIFQRLHTQKEYKGTGIGLALCKKIIERHGGRIWIESKLGVGCDFKFTLPVL